MKFNADEVPIEDRRICERCVKESYLQAIIQTRGDDGECFYCGTACKTYSIIDVAELVEKVVEQHFDHETETDDTGSFNGQEITWVIADVAHIDEQPAADIRALLEDKNFDHERAQMGLEHPFSEAACYLEKATDDGAYREEWFQFEKSLKTEARYFSQSAYLTLKKVFADIENHRTEKGDPVIVITGKGKSIPSLYRARVFQSEAKLETALMRPDREIGPPESALAMAGRMNARGISVFYGATEPETALHELRPPVGSDVVVGRFDFVKDVRLLDIAALAAIQVSGSLFDPTFVEKLERAKFLKTLSTRITRPILPDDELSEYVVTQAIADFLATEFKLDGVIYRSAQLKGGTNVALFHHASRVEEIELPDGIEFFVHTSDYGGDSYERAFSVVERVPKIEKEEHKRVSALDWFSEPALKPSPTLKLDLESLEVREISAVSYAAEKYPVSRTRFEKDDQN